jgi:pyocin large subunit-like protein
LSNHAITWAYKQKIDSCGAKFVLVALADHANDDGFCYPRQSTLARMTAQSERTVRRHLKQLEEVGLIRREVRRWDDGKFKSDGYWLLAPQSALKPHAEDDPPPAKSAADEATNSSDEEASHRSNQPPVHRSNQPPVKVAADPLIGSDHDPPLFDPPFLDSS